MKIRCLLVVVLILALVPGLSACLEDDISRDEKPVLKLYPEEKTDLTVKFLYEDELFVIYPSYADGWHVMA